MSTEVFIPYKPHTATLKVVEQVNAIIGEYLAQGFALTLRQLFYQFVARALLENLFNEYKRLGRIVRDARDGGLVDWDAIEDRTREVNTHTFWTNPTGIIRAAAHPLQYQAGKRFAKYLDQGLIPLVLHLADHDPNGIDMTRDNIERLALYTRAEVEVRRVALNMDQVREYNPPPSFAKETDKRFAAYVREFGTRECWELDALSPTIIADLIRAEVEGLIDRPPWDAVKAKEKRGRGLLVAAAANWTKVEKLLGKR